MNNRIGPEIARRVKQLAELDLGFRHKRREMALALFALFLTLAAVELFLRSVYPQISEHDEMFVYDPELGWGFIPDKRGAIVYPGESQHFVRTNSLGFRDDPPPPPDEEIVRIMVLGDSFVSNVAVMDEDVFTEILERRLERTSVMNFGVNGYGQVQEYLLLERFWDEVRPDLVILVIYIRNDFSDNVGRDWLYPRPVAARNGDDSTLTIVPPPPKSEAMVHRSSWQWYRRIHLYVLINRRLRGLIDRFVATGKTGRPTSTLGPPELDLCSDNPSEEAWDMYRTMEALLLKISGLLEGHGTPYLFVLAPSRVQVDDVLWSSMLQEFGEDREHYDPSLPNDRLMAYGEDHGLPMLDLLPPLRSEVKKGKTLYFPSEEHWTAEGNRVVADILSESSVMKALLRKGVGERRVP
jgi:hypothetical protein